MPIEQTVQGVFHTNSFFLVIYIIQLEGDGGNTHKYQDIFDSKTE